ncbi:type I restriction endonuclease subunit R [Candidatus Saccharibacteria bacterium]|nr:type I restriction endonuclease subunit R [Candidatus Saccharibacteria bacterium]
MTEDKIEQALLDTLASIGWEVVNGPSIGPDGTMEREYTDVVLNRRLEIALARLNPDLTPQQREEVARRIVRTSSAELLADNQDFHTLLTDGVDVEYRHYDGSVRTAQAQLFDFNDPLNNDFVAINQLTVVQDGINRRPDVVLYVNGLPLVVVELKNATDSKANLTAAYNQIQTYKQQISSLFRFNELCVISDGLDARVGTVTAQAERFMSWRTVDGEREEGIVPELEILAQGMFDKMRLLDIVRNFIVFERDSKDDTAFTKKVAAYHQFWAVNRALLSTVTASRPDGDHRAGVVWHTQGSGKSLSMMFYTGKLITDPILGNPTIVVITDRNDLDGQLFDTFSACKDLLRQTPVRAESRENLRDLLKRESGGVIFTTVQKFYPEDGGDTFPMLSERTNIIVMADEAHRSQYGLKARVRESDAQMVYGNAKYMRDALPNASYIGFTGTPIEFEDKSTSAVFGEYIDIYDVQRAVEDKATVPIYYESRLIDLGMDASTKQWLDKEVDDLLEGEEMTRQDKLKAEYAQKEAIVGNSERLGLIAKDIIEHFEDRLSVIEGKGMVVTMSRHIAADLYDKITELRPDWHNDADDEGAIKVIITGSASDEEKLQRHIRGKQRIQTIEKRVKDSSSDLKLVIVCDMWLTGFDVPSMHTMYLDKPLKGHNLMQAIARVNRVYPGKEGGLVVDYLGVAAALRDALETYTQSGGEGKPTLDIDEAVGEMKRRYEIVRDLFHGFDYMRYFGAETRQQLQTILDAQEHILSSEDGAKRLKQHVTELSKAFALSMPHPEALKLREQVAFFQAIKARLDKINDSLQGGPSDADYRMALKQIVDKAIAPVGVVDVFAAAGLEKPNLSILSDEFLAEVRGMERKNLAVEALQKLLRDEVRVRFGRNAIKSDDFSTMLEAALVSYRNGTIEAAQVIEELIDIALKMRVTLEEGKVEGLEEDEVAFYDALLANGSAKQVMEDDQLRNLARLLVEKVRTGAGVDWTLRANAQARLRVEVKKLLNQYGYPPDQQALATDNILKQAELFADDWSRE